MNDPTRKSESDSSSIPRDFETLSASLSKDLSRGLPIDMENALKQIPKERQHEFLERFRSLALGFGSGSSSEASATHETIRRALEQASLDSASETTRASIPNLSGSRTPHTSTLGNYALEDEIGRGGMGVVYRARHQSNGDIVALKVLPNASGDGLHRFKREFRSLADVSHKNLVDLYTLENANGKWFFTMDLLDSSTSFRKYIRPGDQLNVSRLRSTMCQLCDGVKALHDANILHRDLKPSNVMVSEDGHLKILDFGLVTELERCDQTLMVDSVSGTPAFMAPETAAGKPETFASDWYAVGVMLYQAISGKLPFDGSATSVVREKIERDAPQLLHPPELPESWAKLCMQLLSRDQKQRPGYEQISKVIGIAPGQPTTRRSDTQELLGRRWQLSALHTSFRKTQEDNKPIAVFVSGRSGEGKSVLVEKFLDEIRSSDEALIFSGRCYDRESVPFKALDGLIDALASYLRTLPIAEAAILLPDDAGFLATLFSVLQRVQVIAERPLPAIEQFSCQQVRKRAFLALRVLLQRIAKRRNVILVCDDLQWGDADSAEAFVEILSGPQPPNLLVVGCYRSDERQSSPFLNHWDGLSPLPGETSNANDRFVDSIIETELVQVGPLSIAQCKSLVASRIGIQGTWCDSLAAELFEETNGNAYYLHELLECVDVTKRKVHRLPLAEVVANKLASLPAEASDILQTLAASGQATRAAEIIGASGASTNTSTLLLRMQTLKLIRTTSCLGTSGQRERHRRLLEHLEQDKELETTRIFDLARHAKAARQKDKAFKYSLLAAKQASNQQSLPLAIDYYRSAYENSDAPFSGPEAFEFAAGYASSLVSVGEYREAETVVNAAEICVNSPLEKARMCEIVGLARFRRGELDGSGEITIQGLNSLGVWVPTTAIGLAMSYCLLSVQVPAYCLLRGIGIRGKATPRKAQIGSLFSHLITVDGFSRGARAVWSALRSMKFSGHELGNFANARLLTFYNAIFAAINLIGVAGYFGRKSLAAAELSKDQQSHGTAICWMGIRSYSNGNFQEAETLLIRAIEILDGIGEDWNANLSKFHLAMIYYKLGRLDDALVEANSVFERCIGNGDARSGCSAYALLRVSEGILDGGKIASMRHQTPTDTLATCNIEKGLAIWHLRHGRTQEAIEAASKACQLPLKRKLPNFHSFASGPVALMVHRSILEDMPTNSSEYSRHVKATKRLAWYSALLARLCPSEASFIWRECGEVQRIMGKTSKAKRLFEKSIRIAKQQSAQYELAKSRISLARLNESTDAGSELAKCESEMQEFERRIQRGIEQITGHNIDCDHLGPQR